MKKKGEFKASNFIIAIILIVGIFGVIWGFVSKLMINYNVAVPSQHNETFQKITDTSGIDNVTMELKQNAFKDNVNKSTTFFGKLEDRFDILGLYFRLGYETIRLAPKSIGVFTLMSDSVLDSNTNLLGSSAPYLRFMGVAIILILFVFLIIAVAVKWWV